jgi:gliding motility-associated lipoprotein GldH
MTMQHLFPFRRMAAPLLALLLLATLPSCSDAIYESHQAPKEYLRWDKADVMVFEPQLPEGQPGEIWVLLRHHAALGEPSIPMKVKVDGPNGPESFDIDFPILDASGKHVGEVAGDICDGSYKLPTGRPWPAGKYTISISQQSRGDQVPGIMEVGLRVTPVKKAGE